MRRVVRFVPLLQLSIVLSATPALGVVDSAPPPPPAAAPTSSTPPASTAPAQPAASPQPTLPPPAERGRPSRGLQIAGGVTFTVGYGLAASTAFLYLVLVWPFQAAFSEDDSPSAPLMWLAVPVVGPLMTAQDDALKDENDLKTVLYVDAGVQILGIGLFLSSFAARKPARKQKATTSWQVVPGPRGSKGLGLRMKF